MHLLVILPLVRVVLSERSSDDGYAMDTNKWNTCEDFINTTLMERDLMEVKWRMFYHWGDAPDSKYVTISFSWPPQSTVERYQALNVTSVSWYRSPLYMERSDGLAAMLVRTHKPGVYGMLSRAHFDDPKFPVMYVGLKAAGEYLAIMDCLTRFCSLFASADHMPASGQVERAARLFNFRGGAGAAVPSGPRPEPAYDGGEYVDENAGEYV